MKAAVIYTSKHGTTYSIANHIALALNADIASLDELAPGALNTYDTVVLGVPIYSGKAYGAMDLFCRNNLDTLLDKKIGLFISGLQTHPHAQQRQKQTAFLKPLTKHARCVAFVGGALNTAKLSQVEKLLARLSLKRRSDTTEIDQPAIDDLIDALKSSS